MQLNTDTTTPLSTRSLGIDVVAAQLEAHLSAPVAIEQERSHREREAIEERTRLREAGEKAIAALVATRDTPVAEIDPQTTFNQLQKARERWLSRLTQIGTRMRRAMRSDFEAQIEQLSSSEVRHVRVPLDDARKVDVAQRRREFQVKVIGLRKQLTTTSGQLEQLCRSTNINQSTPAPAPVPLPAWDLGKLIGMVGQEITAAETTLSNILRGTAYAICRPRGVALRYGAVLLPLAGAIAVVIWVVKMPSLWPWVGGLGLAALVAMAVLGAIHKRVLSKQFITIDAQLQRADERLTQLENSGLKELDPQMTLSQRLDTITIDDRSAQATALRASAEAAIEQVRTREKRLIERVKGRFAQTLDSLQASFATRHAQHAERFDREILRQEKAMAAALEGCDRRWQAVLTEVQGRWLQSLQELQDFTSDTMRRCLALHPAWSDASWSAWSPPVTYAGEIPVGTMRIALDAVLGALMTRDSHSLPIPPGVTLELPVALAFPAPSSLLIRAGQNCREAAKTLANQLVLRALTSFPAGRLKLTLIDPVGLGDSFKGLLEMGDHDEALLGGGILNDVGRIERGLDDLIAHLEMVIQKHLRGRYATIDDYNREAGEMQEALRLVVVADFPASFSERALEQLAVLARSGARCGVHIIVLHDDRKPIPPVIDLAWFRRLGLVLREVKGRLAVDREGLHAWEFRPEPAPAAALATRLVTDIGHGAQNAKRIEVSFGSISPAADKVWSLSAAKELIIPIGKRGADRLQYLELGKGTCQHVLIGGRTGSGKSTLFHVLVVSAALWYAPRELEFHLIDFKKGVEFKAFASHHLPHARVIAIESDREFGLSVLRHLDRELTRRGDAFRKVGAQDLNAHRRSGGEHLPRILLLIDEFQEFFTEDDAVARDAALLLDRFVRQGRAFGLHVVLGSQTLGGSYALAKSSLGQMGVRIALPCNESDAHLLLHEDNDATRLLSRPGDGIYNDRAGHVEGNSPFQVCWLPEDQEAQNLAHIAALATEAAWKPTQATVVFEGNGPSRLEDEFGLMSMLERPAAPTDASVRAWVGQSSTLGGTTEAVFPSAAGGNLLIVGQNREAAAATCAALMLGLAVRFAPGSLRLCALDGEDAQGPFAALAGNLGTALPHGMSRGEARDLTALITELGATLERRQSGEDTSRTPIVLTIFALQRLRALRPDEDAGFGAAGGEPPSERFAKLLANGPEYGIHTIVWCDSLSSVQRGLGRRSLRDFDARILFQMSSNDSTELGEDDAASRLGLHTALLITQSEGKMEKFRPFSLPDAGILERFKADLRRRFPTAL